MIEQKPPELRREEFFVFLQGQNVKPALIQELRNIPPTLLGAAERVLTRQITEAPQLDSNDLVRGFLDEFESVKDFKVEKK